MYCLRERWFVRRCGAYLATVAGMGGGVWLGWNRWEFLVNLRHRPRDTGPQVFGTELWEGLIASCWVALAAILTIGCGVWLACTLKADIVRRR